MIDLAKIRELSLHQLPQLTPHSDAFHDSVILPIQETPMSIETEYDPFFGD